MAAFFLLMELWPKRIRPQVGYCQMLSCNVVRNGGALPKVKYGSHRAEPQATKRSAKVMDCFGFASQ